MVCSNFVHLHSHSIYSILDSCNKIKNYVKKVKSLGMDACALTDHGVMYGIIEFYKTCKKESIKPILGCEVYVAPKSRLDKDMHDRYHHLVLLAENDKGFYNLQKLCSQGFIDGLYYGKPRVDMELLKEYHEGLIALSGCIAGKIPKLLLANKQKEAEEYAKEMQAIFGENNFFLEIQDHNDKEEQIVMQDLVALSKKTGIPLVATNDCHYTEPEDADAHAFLLLLRDKKTVNSTPSAYGNGQLYVKSPEEMSVLFKHVPEALENTARIAERCNVDIKFHETKMPKAPVPEGVNAWDRLNELCLEGLAEKYPDDDGSIKQQLEYELGIIKTMGFTEYFLIVAEYCNWSRANGVTVGLGRGSAAGSCVAYCLGITNLDPRKYKLVFERFLNPYRISNPDIDVDFSDVNRYKTVEHVRELYGESNVGQIITFTCMTARAAIARVGKCYEYPFAYCNKLASYVPQEPDITLGAALEQSVELKTAYDTDENAKKIIDMALKLEGAPFTTGKHAAGVIISDRPVSEYIPVARTKDGDLVSQYNMIEVEELGLLKMDFLGLKTLSVIDYAIENIKNSKGIEIDINNIPLDDVEVYRYIGKGQTVGIFQIESAGMSKFMKQLKPESIEDIIAGVALYRPGPMDFIPQYIEGKNNPGKIHYFCPELEPILNDTYGCIVYQEQVMQIFQQLAGYSLGGADLVRRAISKKHKDEIEEHRSIFIHGGEIEEGGEKKHIDGCIANGISEKDANDIYDAIEAFASYAFNRAHAACYAMLTYQTAYLKYHYPAEFMSAIMTVFMNNNRDKFVNYMLACKEEGIKILPPDIQVSTDRCSPEGDRCIRLALNSAKGVGLPPMKAIVKWRETNGRIKNISKFFDLCPELGIDKTSVGSMIDSGTLDCFGYTRRSLKKCYKSILSNKTKEKKNIIAGQLSLFDYCDVEYDQINIPEIKEYPEYKKLINEKEVLGAYISGHPFAAYQELLKNVDVYNTKYIRDMNNTDIKGDGLTTCGLITSVKKVYTHKNEPMAFITIEDLSGSLNIIIFPKTYADSYTNIKEDTVVYVTGKITKDNNREDDDSEEPVNSLIADRIIPLDAIEFKLWIKTQSEEDFKNNLTSLNLLTQNNPGNGYIRIYIENTKEVKAYPNKVSLLAVEEAKNIFGDGNVIAQV